MTGAEIVELDTCESTQDEVRDRLVHARAGDCVAVMARSQRAGRGRDGRTWQNPPGTALLLSIGVRGPLPVSILQDLPSRIAAVMMETLGAPHEIAWKAPNDLVASSDGAKVCGVLIDARSTGASVDQVVVGIGCNLTGSRFATADGRTATSLSALGITTDARSLAERLCSELWRLLTEVSSARS